LETQKAFNLSIVFLITILCLCLLSTLVLLALVGSRIIENRRQISQFEGLPKISTHTIVVTAPDTLATPLPPKTPEPFTESPSLDLQDTSTFDSIITSTFSPLTGSLPSDAWCVPWNSQATRAKVVNVLDGVTIEVELEGNKFQIRYIGLDMLEAEQDPAFLERALEANRELIQGKDILLIKDVSDTDAEGRLLRYVIAETNFINQEMIARGYSIARSAPPNIRCDQLFLEAEKQAISAGRGLWAATPTPTRTFLPPTATVSFGGDIVVIKVARRGSIWQEPEEYVEIYNAGTNPVQLLGWTLRDLKNHVFNFPSFVLGPGQYCRIYTNLYRPDQCGFSYFNPSPIWDNDHDCAILKNSDGGLAHEFCYD